MKLFELFYLMEGRAEYIANQMGKKLKMAAQNDSLAKEYAEMEDMLPLVQKLSEADPTGKEKALQFIVKAYVTGQMKLEDIAQVRTDLETFFKVRNQLPNKDLNSYKTLKDLYNALRSVKDEPEQVSNKQQKRNVKQEGATYVIDTPNFKVVIPKTEEAACTYGSGTRWCTAARESSNMFDQYNKDGNLYIIMTKDRKFQMQYESDSFMDEDDSEISQDDIEYLSKFPQYADFLNMLIKKHYGKYFEGKDA